MENNSQRDYFAPFLSDDAFTGPFLLVARLLSTVLFVFYILQEIFETSQIRAYMDMNHVPSALIYPVLVIQIAGCVMVALGYRTRFAALMMAGFTITAALLFDTSQSINILKDLGIAGGFFFMFAFGPGPLSLDARQQSTKPAGTEDNSHRGFFSPILSNNLLMGPLLFVGRVFAAVIFLVFGRSKVLHTAFMQAYMVNHNHSFAAWNQLGTLLIYPAMWLQIFGGLLVVVGYKARYAFLALAGFTILAGSMFHHQFYIEAEKIQFMKDYTLTGVLLFMFAFGPGPLSLDAFLSRAKPTRQKVEVAAPNA